MASLGLLAWQQGRWQLLPPSRCYLLSGSEGSARPLLELMLEQPPLRPALDHLHQAVENDRPSLVHAGGQSWAERLYQQPGFAGRFAAAMDVHSRPAATAWTHPVPLAHHRRLLDVGGGFGTHSRAALEAAPGLEAHVLELPAVVVAAGAQADERLRFASGDLWYDAWPEADLHFFSDVFHDWPLDRCSQLARRSFECLPPRGRIVVHEMLLDEDRAGPAAVVANAVSMLLWSEGQQLTAGELRALLEGAGFARVRVERTFGCWAIAQGEKP